MSSLLALHALAVARGDGLAPRLHDLLATRARLIEHNPAVLQLPTGLIQAGPNPAPCTTGFMPGNVVVLPVPACEHRQGVPKTQSAERNEVECILR